MTAAIFFSSDIQGSVLWLGGVLLLVWAAPLCIELDPLPLLVPYSSLVPPLSHPAKARAETALRIKKIFFMMFLRIEFSVEQSLELKRGAMRLNAGKPGFAGGLNPAAKLDEWIDR